MTLTLVELVLEVKMNYEVYLQDGVGIGCLGEKYSHITKVFKRLLHSFLILPAPSLTEAPKLEPVPSSTHTIL